MMGRSDRMIMIALPLVALAVGFWLLVLGPKREEASELGDEIAALQQSIDDGNAQIAVAEAARKDFPKDYGELVTLGRATPATDDQATLVFDLGGLSRRNELSFRNFEVTAAGGETAAPAVESEPEGSAETPEEGAEPTAETTAATTAPATEAGAATLPIGASPGEGAFAVMPYEFRFLGNFFDVASFLSDVDSQVETRGGKTKVSGRLLTINGFSLTGNGFEGFPSVEANFSVTSYVLPEGQDPTVGATPGGPAPVAPGAAPQPAAPVSTDGVTP